MLIKLQVFVTGTRCSFEGSGWLIQGRNPYCANNNHSKETTKNT